MSEQWLKARKRGVGGSDIAAICGLSPWKTPYQVYLEKTEDGGDRQEPTEAMAYGTLMEPVIRQWYSNETGRTVVVPELIVHPKYSFIVGSLDGIADSCRVWEGKTARSSQDWGEPGSDEIPIYYMTQVQWYMNITGLDVADVTVSFSGTIPVNYEIPADKELQEMMIEEAASFWKMVESKTPPDPTSMADALLMFGKLSVAQEMTASQNEEVIVARLKAIAAEQKALEQEAIQIKAKVMISLGEKDTLVDLSGKPLVTWKIGKVGKTFDVEALKTEHPETYHQYLKSTTASRRFLLK